MQPLPGYFVWNASLRKATEIAILFRAFPYASHMCVCKNKETKQTQENSPILHFRVLHKMISARVGISNN